MQILTKKWRKNYWKYTSPAILTWSNQPNVCAIFHMNISVGPMPFCCYGYFKWMVVFYRNLKYDQYRLYIRYSLKCYHVSLPYVTITALCPLNKHIFCELLRRKTNQILRLNSIELVLLRFHSCISWTHIHLAFIIACDCYTSSVEK